MENTIKASSYSVIWKEEAFIEMKNQCCSASLLFC